MIIRIAFSGFAVEPGGVSSCVLRISYCAVETAAPPFGRLAVTAKLGVLVVDIKSQVESDFSILAVKR